MYKKVTVKKPSNGIKNQRMIHVCVCYIDRDRKRKREKESSNFLKTVDNSRTCFTDKE